MTSFRNAKLVLRDRIISGSLAVQDGVIVAIDEGGASDLASGCDMDGDYLIPGVVDVHTDNLERQVQPRATARWPSRSAMLAHDAQCAAAGVTTVLDALCLGDLQIYQGDNGRIRTFRDAVVDLDALGDTGLLKSEHFLHLRCEMPSPDVIALVDPVADNKRVRMISLMDHSPGVGQYANLDQFRNARRKEGKTDEFIERRIAELTEQRARWRKPNRAALLARAAGVDVPLASHDDRTPEEIEENYRDGIRISEFPVTLEAAAAARARGMQVVAGAPNIVRGGSHSGNIDAAELVRAGVVDALASDYVPASLVEAAFICARETGITLPASVAMITDNAARMAHLPDRGRIEVGMRADLVRVRVHEGMPVVRQVWRAGERVA